MLIDATLKLLIINIHKNLFSFAVPIMIPFPLEIDVNNFNLYSELDKLPGIKNFAHVGNVVSNVIANITVNTVQKTAATNTNNLLSSIGVPTNDTSTGQQASLTQQPTGQQLQLRITFEPRSLLPGILYGYLQAAAKNVKDYTFTYISNDLVAWNLKLGTVSPDFSNENTVMDIVFTEELPATANGVGSITNPGSQSLGQQNIK